MHKSAKQIFIKIEQVGQNNIKKCEKRLDHRIEKVAGTFFNQIDYINLPELEARILDQNYWEQNLDASFDFLVI